MKPGRFSGYVCLRWCDKTWWRVEKSFSYTTADGDRYTVPRGMVTDLGSIPRVFWRVLHRSEFAPAYLVHDYLYEAHCTTRREADRILLEGISTLTAGDATGKRIIIWIALRLFGGFVWQRK
ncbi:MAG: DUF1353 domain-containing protein [Dehalococcoidia bacterium]